jgi:hypothetical protein
VNNADTDPDQPYLSLWGNDIWGKVRSISFSSLDSSSEGSPRTRQPSLLPSTSHHYLQAFAVRNLSLSLPDPFCSRYFGLNPGAIRIAAIASHAVNTTILYFLGLKVLFPPPLTLTGLQIIGNPAIVFLATLLFATHPVHVEVSAPLLSVPCNTDY